MATVNHPFRSFEKIEMHESASLGAGPRLGPEVGAGEQEGLTSCILGRV